MSLKNYAFLVLRSRGYTPRESLRIIRTAISLSAKYGGEGFYGSFEQCINICLECHGAEPIFSDLRTPYSIRTVCKNSIAASM